MKRALCLLLILVLTLSACSVGGTYNFVRMEADGETYDAEAVKALGKDPDSCYICLWADGTGMLSIFGQTVDIEWEDGRLWPGGSPEDAVAYQLEGNTLTLEYEDQKLVFCK